MNLFMPHELAEDIARQCPPQGWVSIAVDADCVVVSCDWSEDVLLKHDTETGGNSVPTALAYLLSAALTDRGILNEVRGDMTTTDWRCGR